ncbi:MAG: L,D-transpeptidase [Legionellales bacterium]|nr:L,D-transpeptidase [Legionellales bacterium]
MKVKCIVIFTVLLVLNSSVANSVKRFGEKYCNQDGYYCHKVEKGESWRTLFPDADERLIVKKLNRMNVKLKPKMKIAVPKNLSSLEILDIAPLEKYIENDLNDEFLVVNQTELAWGAYNERGKLIAWGPISSGKNYCPDVGRSCKTAVGKFNMYTKRGPKCKSSKYPIGRGGAPMPYCMFFHGGYAFHGSPDVPGYRASHGCVRLFVEDAKWLHKNFIDLPNKGDRGTTVFVEEL